MKKKLIALFLTLCCAFCLAGITACDEEDEDSVSESVVSTLFESSSFKSSSQAALSSSSRPATGAPHSSSSQYHGESSTVHSGNASAESNSVESSTPSGNASAESNSVESSTPSGNAGASSDSSSDSAQTPPATQGLKYTLKNDVYSVTGIGTATDSNIIIPRIYNNRPVTSIGNRAFQNCKGITSVSIGDAVTSIESFAFGDCENLTSVTIPDSVISLMDNAFDGCDKLIENGNGLAYVGDWLIGYYDSYISRVNVREGIRGIADYAFGDAYLGNYLKQVTLPDSVKVIGKNAFRNRDRLNELSIGKGITYIGEQAFYNCENLAVISLPKNVAYIGNNAFENCIALERIIVDETNEYYASYDGILYNKSKTDFVCVPLGISGEIDFPDSIRKIGDSSFHNCKSLTSITIPEGVTSIGDYAFQGCSSLVNVTLPDSLVSIDFFAFANCRNLTSITIPSNVSYIGRSAFEGCTSLSIVINHSNLTITKGSTDYGYVGYYATKIYSTTGNGSTKEDFVEEGNFLSYTAFQASSYSITFKQIIGDTNNSLANAQYEYIKQDQDFMNSLHQWELENLIVDPTKITETKWLQKESLYKIALFDILGVATEDKTDIFSVVSNSANNFMTESVNTFLKLNELTLDDLKTTDLDSDLLGGIDLFKDLEFLDNLASVCDTMYDAVLLCCNYKALSYMNDSYCKVLEKIAADDLVPEQLRKAANDCITHFKAGADETLAGMITGEFAKKGINFLVNKLFDEAWDSLLYASGLKVLNLVGKGFLAIKNSYGNLDAKTEAWYLLETTVHLENSLRRVISDMNEIDYLNVANATEAETYMSAIELFNNCVYRGFDCVKDFFQAYLDAPSTSEEDKVYATEQIGYAVQGKERREKTYGDFEADLSAIYQNTFYPENQ